MLQNSVILGLLFIGFCLLFRRIRWLKLMEQLLQRTREGMDEAARKRLLENRRDLLTMQRKHGWWYKLEQELYYSGLMRHFPFLTVENWMVGNLVLLSCVFLLILFVTGKWLGALVGGGLLMGTEYLIIWFGRLREMRSVNDNLLKFLNFLGNYSITAGEVTGIFKQVSRYVEEPMKSALLECSMEAQTTGDAGMALLSMAEKVEHPKFKEVVRNLEISIRYCADFTVLVSSSRRSIREYLRQGEARKGMLREAVVNMVLLLGMSFFALVTVDGLIEASIWTILVHTIPGRLAIAVVLLILLLLLGQLHKINR